MDGGWIKGSLDPWQRSLFVPPVSSANTKEKGPLLAGKNFACSSRKKSRLFFLLSSLQLCFFPSICLDCFMIFSSTRHECVIVFMKCSCPISLCFILSCLDILKWKAFLIKPTVCSISKTDATIDERN